MSNNKKKAGIIVNVNAIEKEKNGGLGFFEKYLMYKKLR